MKNDLLYNFQRSNLIKNLKLKIKSVTEEEKLNENTLNKITVENECFYEHYFLNYQINSKEGNSLNEIKKGCKENYNNLQILSSHPNFVKPLYNHLEMNEKTLIYSQEILTKNYKTNMEFLSKINSIDYKSLKNYTCQILSAMAYAEYKGLLISILHIKSIYLNTRNQIRINLFDFKNYKKQFEWTGFSNERLIIKFYSPPELYDNNKERLWDKAVVYSWGICMLQILNGNSLDFDQYKAKQQRLSYENLLNQIDKIIVPLLIEEQFGAKLKILIKYSLHYNPTLRPSFIQLYDTFLKFDMVNINQINLLLATLTAPKSILNNDFFNYELRLFRSNIRTPEADELNEVKTELNELKSSNNMLKNNNIKLTQITENILNLISKCTGNQNINEDTCLEAIFQIIKENKELRAEISMIKQVKLNGENSIPVDSTIGKGFKLEFIPQNYIGHNLNSNSDITGMNFILNPSQDTKQNLFGFYNFNAPESVNPLFQNNKSSQPNISYEGYLKLDDLAINSQNVELVKEINSKFDPFDGLLKQTDQTKPQKIKNKNEIPNINENPTNNYTDDIKPSQINFLPNQNFNKLPKYSKAQEINSDKNPNLFQNPDVGNKNVKNIENSLGYNKNNPFNNEINPAKKIENKGNYCNICNSEINLSNARVKCNNCPKGELGCEVCFKKCVHCSFFFCLKNDCWFNHCRKKDQIFHIILSKIEKIEFFNFTNSTKLNLLFPQPLADPAFIYIDKSFYFIGGTINSILQSKCDLFVINIEKASYQLFEKPHLKLARSGIGGSFLDPNSIIIGGGYSQNNFLKSCEKYDAKGEIWSTLPYLNIPKAYSCLVCMNGSISMSFGGQVLNKSAITYTDKIEIINFKIKNFWEIIELANGSEHFSPRCGLKAELYEKNLIFLFGGINGIKEFNECWTYSLQSNFLKSEVVNGGQVENHIGSGPIIRSNSILFVNYQEILSQFSKELDMQLIDT